MKNKILDTKDALDLHRKLIKQKPILRSVYDDFYSKLTPKNVPKGKVVEIGSGGGFIRDIIPNVVTSDVIAGAGIDKVFSATKIPYKNSSVSAFLMIDVLHHIKDPEKAFKEMERCLKKRGKIIMIEPYNSLWGGIIFKYLHYENFDPSGDWKVQGKGRMSDSNTALPWIIFTRDRKTFVKKFPGLKIIKVEPHTPFRYLVSGGVTKPQLIPTFLYQAILSLENFLSPLKSHLSMFVTIELQKV